MQPFEPWEIIPRRAMLDHSDLGCLWRYRHTLLTEAQEGLLHVLRDKIDRFPNYFARVGQSYDQTAGLVLMSDWHRRVDFITCMDKSARRKWGVMNSKRPVLNCRYWRLCDHCAWRREMDLQGRFVKKFDLGLWLFMTFSFTGFLPMGSGYLRCSNSPVSHADLIKYWDANRFVVGQMIAEGMIRGAVLVDELHLEWLYPTPLATPHSHIVALADDLPSELDIARIKAWMARFRGQVMDVVAEADNRQWDTYLLKRDFFRLHLRKTKPRKPPLLMETDPRLKIELPVSIDMKPLVGQTDFSNCLGYLVKPLNLAGAYERTRAALLRTNTNGLGVLAQNVNEFIVGSDLLMTPRRSPAYFGVCDARRPKLYIGQKGEMLENQDYRAEIKGLLSELKPDLDETDTDSSNVEGSTVDYANGS